MKTRWVVTVLCAAAIVGTLWHFRTHTIAYRLTLEVKVNGETFTGSGVVASDYSINANLLAVGAEIASHERGEAIPVDLGKYGQIFLTLRGRHFLYGLAGVTFELGTPGQGQMDFLRELAILRPPREILHKDLPLLVRFRDPTQPRTVECVDPDNMAASFPPGTEISLVHATIAIVDERVTSGRIEKYLPWLGLSYHDIGPLLNAPSWRSNIRLGDWKSCSLGLYHFDASK